MRIRNITAAAAVALLAGPVSAATIVNGGFEDSSVSSGFVDSFNVGFNPNGLPGWTVAGGGVDLVSNGLWDPAEGVNSLDMASGTPGTIFQDITDLVIGQVYNITFAMAGNPFGDFAPEIHTLGVAVGNLAPGNHVFDTAGLGPRNMGWVDRTYTFTANQTSMRLTFYTEDTDGDPRTGPTLDNVRISEAVSAAVPLPATGLLLIGALGALRMRRRRG